MAELADAADSKSAELRPLGFAPLPAPSLKPATDAAFNDIGPFQNSSASDEPEMFV